MAIKPPLSNGWSDVIMEEKAENRRMEEALQRLKEAEEKKA